MPRLFRVIAYSAGRSNGEASCSSTSVLIPHRIAHLGMSLLGPEFRRDHRAPFSSLTLSGTVVFWSLRRIARCRRSWHSRNLRGGRDRVIDGNTTNSPRRRDTAALAPHFHEPRPKDRGSVGSTQVCRWPPGGVSGRAASASKSAGLRRDVSDVPVATPQKSETAREKSKSLRTPLGDRCAAGHKTHPPSPFVSFPGFPLTRVADSVCTWWDHPFEGSRSP